LNGRGKIYPTRSGDTLSDGVCSSGSKTRPSALISDSMGRCPSPRTGTRRLAMEGTGRPFPRVEGHPPQPPAVRRRSIAPERPRKIASKQLNAVTPRTRASGAQKPARVKRRTLRLFEVCGEGPPPQHDSIAQPVIGETSYHAPPPRQTLLPAHISLSHLV
jgi:hypothetical protein